MGYKKEESPQPRTRQLRRKEATPDALSNLLNFEENSDIIDPVIPLKFIDKPIGKVHALTFDFEHDPKNAAVPRTDLKEGESDSKKGRGRRGLRQSTIKKHHHMDDPLSDHLYELYHRRMEKEEKKMVNRDKEKIYFEADKLKSDLDSLKSPEWVRYLPHITFIHDLKSHEEMVKNRDLTINYIENQLGKFESYKRREDRITKRGRLLSSQDYKMIGNGRLTEKDLQIYSNVDRYEYMGVSDTDEEEQDMTNEQIRLHRLNKISKKFGPRIKLKFGKGRVLIAEPFSAPRIENLHGKR